MPLIWIYSHPSRCFLMQLCSSCSGFICASVACLETAVVAVQPNGNTLALINKVLSIQPGY